jgi:hypothetical protein
MEDLPEILNKRAALQGASTALLSRFTEGARHKSRLVERM